VSDVAPIPEETDASALRRLGWWLRERFPPVVYTVLVVLYAVSANAVARGLGGDGRAAPAAAIVVWLAFLHLRIFDEHKDFAADRVNHPERVLSRGLVTLPMLARVGLIAVIGEAAIAAMLGRRALLAWAAVLGFSLAMRFEFGVGGWLRHHLVAYAITHNPIVGLLALFLYAASQAPWSDGYLWYVALVSVASLGFEIGRKTRRPDEEQPGVETYTSALGQARGRALLGAVHAGTALATIGLAWTLGAGPAGLVLAALVVLPGLATTGAKAKAAEAGASVTLLLAMLAAAILARTA
jgi:hypothetical protein